MLFSAKKCENIIEQINFIILKQELSTCKYSYFYSTSPVWNSCYAHVSLKFSELNHEKDSSILIQIMIFQC